MTRGMELLKSLFRASLPGAGSLICFYLLLHSLWTGSSVTAGRRSLVLGVRHSAATEPSQFWFMQVLFLAGAIGFGYLAWKRFGE